MARILAQRVSGPKAGLDAPLHQHALRGNRNCEDRGLGKLRQLQLLLGAFKAQLRKRKPERLVGLVKYLFCDGKFFREIAAHANRLRPLPRKKKCKFHFIHDLGISNHSGVRCQAMILPRTTIHSRKLSPTRCAAAARARKPTSPERSGSTKSSP